MPRSILEFGIFPSNRLRFPLLIAFVISCISCSLFSGYRLLALFCQIFKTRICEVNGNYEVLLLAASFFISITGMILFFGRIIIFQRDVDKKGMILFLSCCCLGCFFVFTCPGVFWYSSAGELLLKAERIQLPVILLGGGILFGSFLYFIIKELFELIKIILSKLFLWRFSDMLPDRPSFFSL